MMRPIEPGCLAIIVVGEDAGRVVTAVRWVREDEIVHGWLAGRTGWLVESGKDIGVYAEWGLLRIDGGDSTADKEREYQEVCA